MTELIEALRKHWLGMGVKLNHGAADEEIMHFEAANNVRLPPDFRAYVSAINGYNDGYIDDEVVTFLPLNEIKTLKEIWLPDTVDGASYYVFADWLISAHVYAIYLSENADEKNSVVVAPDETPVKIADSFTEFISEYLRDKNAILFSF